MRRRRNMDERLRRAERESDLLRQIQAEIRAGRILSIEHPLPPGLQPDHPSGGEFDSWECARYLFAFDRGFQLAAHEPGTTWATFTQVQPFTFCGLNADWSREAWHLGPSPVPNQNDGDFYLVSQEEYLGYPPEGDPDDEQVSLRCLEEWTLFQRFHMPDEGGLTPEDELVGNDELVEQATGSMRGMVQAWARMSPGSVSTWGITVALGPPLVRGFLVVPTDADAARDFLAAHARVRPRLA